MVGQIGLPQVSVEEQSRREGETTGESELLRNQNEKVSPLASPQLVLAEVNSPRSLDALAQRKVLAITRMEPSNLCFHAKDQRSDDEGEDRRPVHQGDERERS